MDEIEKIISLWIGRITQPRQELGNYSICPFAKKIPILVKTSKLSADLFTNLTDEITIFCEVTPTSTFKEIDDLCEHLNRKYKSHIFLPDHPERKTYIKNIETGNGKYPLIIAQTKTELFNSRKKLSKTNYYTYWDSEYLEEIFNYGNLDRVGQTN